MSVELGLEIRARTDSAQRSQLFMNVDPIQFLTYFMMKHLQNQLHGAERLLYTQIFQKCPASNGTWRLIIMLTTISNWSTQPHHTSLWFTFNIIHLLTDTCSKWSLCFSIQTKILHPFLMLATCPAYLMLPYLVTLILTSEKYKLWSPCSLHNFLQPAVTFSLLHPNILLGNFFSNTITQFKFFILGEKDDMSIWSKRLWWW